MPANIAKLPGSLLVTTSRRTGKDQTRALTEALASDRTTVWDSTGDNPYPGWLGLADAIIVTGDSVNMVTEACAAGKPVYVVDLPGGSAKFRAFHEMMLDGGHVRRFDGSLDDWTPAPLDDTAGVAETIRAKLIERGVQF